jgi:hypothetical protein
MTTRNNRGRKIGGRSASSVLGSCQQRLNGDAKRKAVLSRQEAYLSAVARWEVDAWSRLQKELTN